MVRAWNRLPRETADVPSLQVFKARLNVALCNLIQGKISMPMSGWLD